MKYTDIIYDNSRQTWKNNKEAIQSAHVRDIIR